MTFRGTPIRKLGIILAALAFASLPILLACGCASGTVTTSTGAVVDAGVVQAQDTAGDILKVLSDGYRAAVVKHDALGGKDEAGNLLEPAEVHAARRERLLKQAAGLRAGWGALEASKAAASGSVAEVLLAIGDILPDLVKLIREFIPGFKIPPLVDAFLGPGVKP